MAVDLAVVAGSCVVAGTVAWIDCWNDRMECVSSSKKVLEGDDRDSRLGTSRLFSSRFALALACLLARMDGWKDGSSQLTRLDWILDIGLSSNLVRLTERESMDRLKNLIDDGF